MIWGDYVEVVQQKCLILLGENGFRPLFIPSLSLSLSL